VPKHVAILPARWCLHFRGTSGSNITLLPQGTNHRPSVHRSHRYSRPFTLSEGAPGPTPDAPLEELQSSQNGTSSLIAASGAGSVDFLADLGCPGRGCSSSAVRAEPQKRTTVGMISTDVCSPSFESYVRICSRPFTKQPSPFFKCSAQAVPNPLKATIMWNLGKIISLTDCFFFETSFLRDQAAHECVQWSNLPLGVPWALSDSNVLCS
jgi:hypothetical protein